MSDITVINDSQQSELVTNGLAKNGELYFKDKEQPHLWIDVKEAS